VRLTAVLFAWMKAICRHRRFDAKSNLHRESGAGILITRNYFSIDPRHFYSTRRGESVARGENCQKCGLVPQKPPLSACGEGGGTGG
jgi:hypothetical protein